MYLCRELTDLSLPQIARVFKRRDHTTVIHAIKKVQQRLKTEPALSLTLERIRTTLLSPAALEMTEATAVADRIAPPAQLTD